MILRILTALLPSLVGAIKAWWLRRNAVTGDRAKRALEASQARIDAIQEAHRDRAKAEAMDDEELVRAISRKP